MDRGPDGDEIVLAELAHDELGSRIDASVPHSARRYDYLLGGTNNFAADRASAELLEAELPGMRLGVRENRRFLVRAVDHLARAGVRQFLDVGAGLPTSPNVHEVAQAVDPRVRVLYVDNDPIVLVHARTLLAGNPAGATAYLEADLRRPATILDSPRLRATLDLSEPVGLILVGILQYFLDDDDPRPLVRALLEPLAPGSHLVAANGTYDHHPREAWPFADDVMRRSGLPMRARTRAEFAEFFEGLDLVDPGIVPLAEWRADGEPQPRPAPEVVNSYGAVGRKRG